MRKLIIYTSKHNHTKKVASFFSDLFDVCHVKDVKDIDYYDLVFFICPTYGDEELPFDMEDFLINLKSKNKLYIVCELGNYFGLDELEWGAAKIIKNVLNDLNWKEYYKSLSLDSYPKINEEQLIKWKSGLYAFLLSE